MKLKCSGVDPGPAQMWELFGVDDGSDGGDFRVEDVDCHDPGGYPCGVTSYGTGLTVDLEKRETKFVFCSLTGDGGEEVCHSLSARCDSRCGWHDH